MTVVRMLADAATTRRARRPSLHCITVLAPHRLKTLYQIANANRIGLAMPMTGDRIGSSRRFDQDVRPKDSRRNLYRCHLRNRNALFAAAEQTPLHAAHAQRADHDARRKPQISFGPAARAEVLVGSSGAWGRRIWTGFSLTHSRAPLF